MAAGIIKALFGIGKGQMKTIPWTKLTPELHNQLSSQLGKLMFVIKSQNLKLTKFQEDYLRNQLKHMDEFEKRVLTKTETPKPKGEVRPFMGFTPEVIPGGKKLVPSRTGKKKPINVNYTEAEKKLGFPIGEVKYLEDLVDIEKMPDTHEGLKNWVISKSQQEDYLVATDVAEDVKNIIGGGPVPRHIKPIWPFIAFTAFNTLPKEFKEIYGISDSKIKNIVLSLNLKLLKYTRPFLPPFFRLIAPARWAQQRLTKKPSLLFKDKAKY